jgi:RIO-like serine/threonine protein kinase
VIDYKVTRLIRRNSVVEFHKHPARSYVLKQYFARYTSQDEYEFYKKLSTLLTGLEGVRIPEIYAVNQEKNTICLELIEGHALTEELKATGFIVLEKYPLIKIVLIFAMLTTFSLII